MKVHEYQARQLLSDSGVPVPPAIVARSGEEAAKAYAKLASQHNADLAVVKAQVYAGGRGKGGGVKLVRSADEARQVAADILSRPLVTPQTGPSGVPVSKVLVAVGVDIEKEFYLAVTVDRANHCPMLIASSEGGVEIEQVAKDHPGTIVRAAIDPEAGLQPYQARVVAYRLGLVGEQVEAAVKIMRQLCRLFLTSDASLVEINPLVATPDGQLLAIDAKINFDDNALFRHEDIVQLADPAEENESERRAKGHDLSYIKLDGNIGCLVNGAGLAMATMDLIKLHGGEPANFLDVGGSATEEAVTEAFAIILADPNVKGVLVNIFGGIARCDVIATAIVNAARKVGFNVPLVVRLEGTNVQEARRILDEVGDEIAMMQTGTDLTDAAEKITRAIAA